MSDLLQAKNAPWYAHCDESTNWWTVIVDKDNSELGSTDGGFEADQAVIMAAAPEMMAVLEMVQNHYAGNLTYQPPYVKAAMDLLSRMQKDYDTLVELLNQPELDE